ncbi:MAG TPA: helix-hairpin-helix domain-containing protein [Puia sp.]|nr:helix-hairpin-helix domain-containing protein [Puia sp.]
MWETIRGYLTFTRKERYGVLFLLLLISIFFVLPYFFKPSPGDRDPETYNKIQGGLRKFESRMSDSPRKADSHGRYLRQKIFSAAGNQAEADKHAEVHMFYFDPNKIQTTDWIRLGLPDRLAQTIRHYMEKGGRFQKAEDLKKLYGLHNADYERLYPFVRISRPPGEIKAGTGYNKTSTEHISAIRKMDSFFHEPRPIPDYPFKRAVKFFTVTDVNLSDSNEWSRLPGIGEKLASRIIHFREKLGGFYQVNQVAETYGLPDTTFQKIKPYLRIQSVSLLQIDINTATKEILMSHPYIRWPLARSIIEYRSQHGSFHSLNELLQLALMDSAKFEKLKPYLIVNQE